METTQRTRSKSLVEVGHKTHDVRQFDAGVKRGTALVINQYERDLLGTQSSRKPYDESA